VTLANWVHIWGHWPVIAAVAIALYRWNRPGYALLRNAVFISGAIGFLFFALLPVAPPRLLEVGLVDTVLERSTAYRALQPPELTNQYRYRSCGAAGGSPIPWHRHGLGGGQGVQGKHVGRGLRWSANASGRDAAR
jgi:PAP2 superfamily